MTRTSRHSAQPRSAARIGHITWRCCAHLAPITITLIVALTLLFLTSEVFGQDTVVVKTSEPGVTANRKGTIISWRGPELVLELSGTTKAIANEEIVRLETRWSDEYQAATALLVERKIAAAVDPLRAALAGEARDWAKTIIQADLVRALAALGAEFEASQHFVQILAADPETRFVELAPLAWDSSFVDARFAEAAVGWTKLNNPFAKILGASWLLGTNERATAVQILNELSRDVRPEVAHLASAQLWRFEMLTADSSQVDRWYRQLQRMPMTIQPGPYLTVGMAYERLGRTDDSLLALLRIPIVHDRDWRLCAIALGRAATLMESNQQIPEARRLWLEIVTKYPNSTWTKTAREHLQQE